MAPAGWPTGFARRVFRSGRGIGTHHGNRRLGVALGDSRLPLEWYHGEWPEARVAINVSPRQLLDHRFVEKVQALLLEFEVPARCIEIELTETVLANRHGHDRHASPTALRWTCDSARRFRDWVLVSRLPREATVHQNQTRPKSHRRHSDKFAIGRDRESHHPPLPRPEVGSHCGRRRDSRPIGDIDAAPSNLSSRVICYLSRSGLLISSQRWIGSRKKFLCCCWHREARRSRAPMMARRSLGPVRLRERASHLGVFRCPSSRGYLREFHAQCFAFACSSRTIGERGQRRVRGCRCANGRKIGQT